ncbi:Outer membrane lipid asymmetry maintenance protein [Candidatus Hepatincolaceae symbiont of Richtersius coronifer]
MVEVENKILNFSVGVAVLIFLILFFLFHSKDYTGDFKRYKIVVKDATGIKKNTPVNIGGLKVGTVEGLSFSKEVNNFIIVNIKVRKNISLSLDSLIAITSSSLFAPGKTINIINGFETALFKEGDTIYNTNVGLDLNQVLDLISYYKTQQQNSINPTNKNELMVIK